MAAVIATKDPLETICEGILEEKGWDAQYRFEFLRQQQPLAMMAWIELSNLWTIKVMVHQELEKLIDGIVNSAKFSSVIQNPYYSLMYFGMAHEHGHWLICPFNDNGHMSIVQGAREVLETKLVTQSSIDSATQKAVNMIEDLINNSVLSYEDARASEFAEGFTLFYLLNAQDYSKGSFVLPRRLPEDFSLFLNSNLTMMQAPEEFYGRVKRHFKAFASSIMEKDTAQTTLILFGDETLAQKAITHALSPQDKAYAAAVLRDRSRWYEVSKGLTELWFRYIKDTNPRAAPNSLSELLDKLRREYENMQKQQQQQPSQSPPAPFPPSNVPPESEHYELSDDFGDPEGRGKQPRQQQQKTGKGGAGFDEQTDEKNGGSKEAAKANKETIFGGAEERDVQDKNQKARGQNDDNGNRGYLPLQQPKFPTFHYPDSLLDKFLRIPEILRHLFEDSLIAPEIHNFGELDATYRSRAAPLVINLRDERKQSPQHNVRYLEREPVDLQRLRPSQVDWARTRAFPTNGEGEEGRKFQFFEKRTPFTLDIPAALASGGIPDLAWIVDSSGSMSWKPEEGRGEYDVLARVVYSTHLSLERSGKGLHMKYALVNFSGKTAFTGWKPYQELDQIHKALFAYQGLGTHLHPKAIRQLLATSNDVFLTFMVTDGGFNLFANEDAIVSQVKEVEARGNYFVLFQIGSESGFSRKLREQGTPVFLIETPRDLYGLTVDFSRRAWGEVR